MGQPIEYQQQMTEVVYINLPGPEEPVPGMSGGELLHGFLADLHRDSDKNVKEFLEAACAAWNIHYRTVRV